MSNSSFKYTPLIFVCGPTCSGKSELAIQIAEHYGTEIINGDSVQLFAGVDIGTAKPSPEDLHRVPHHLFSVIEKGDACTAGEYRRRALEYIQRGAKDRPLVIVGGSGFYLQALELGMFDVEEVSSEALHQIDSIYSAQGLKGLFERLRELDSAHAHRVYEQDEYRIRRALGLMLTLNKSMTEIHRDFALQQEKTKLPHPILKLGVDVEREALRKRVVQRTEKMIDRGLVQEVQSLLGEGLSEWAPMKSIGYKEVVDHLNGQYGLDEMKEEIIKNTMRLAKRQRTWFKKDKQIQWLNGLDPSEQKWHLVDSIIREWLTNLESLT